MAQEFQQPVDSASPRAQRMTADESRAVIALWQRERVEQTGLTDRPAVPDVAEGLDVSVEDVQRLLSEVRARRLEEEQALISEQALAAAERRLAEEEADLSEIRQHRAELRWQEKETTWHNANSWQSQQATPRLRRGKPRQPAPVEWTGAEDYWQKTEEDIEAGKQYRAQKAKQGGRYALYAILTAFLVPALFVLCLYVLGTILNQ